MFERCCSERFTKNYILHHSPKPISFYGDMAEIIKNLLWYVPNIDSYQADTNELIQDKIYSDFSFSFILNEMGMVEDRDVKWIGSGNSSSVDEDDWNYYENKICCKCQKAIITRVLSKSKTNDFLRSLRNCIAHGHFAIVDDYIIGFNLRSHNNPESRRAVIKIKPHLLLKALKALTSPRGKELLVLYAFQRIGYKEIKQPRNKYHYLFDFIIEKEGKRYALEIKDFRGQSYLHPEHLTSFLAKSDLIAPGIERVLFIDTSRITKAVKEIVKGIDRFRIIDLPKVKDLLAENPVDILDSK